MKLRHHVTNKRVLAMIIGLIIAFTSTVFTHANEVKNNQSKLNSRMEVTMKVNRENKSIGVFIDGGYFAKINEALQDNLSINVSISGLFSFICGEIEKGKVRNS